MEIEKLYIISRIFATNFITIGKLGSKWLLFITHYFVAIE